MPRLARARARALSFSLSFALSLSLSLSQVRARLEAIRTTVLASREGAIISLSGDARTLDAVREPARAFAAALPLGRLLRVWRAVARSGRNLPRIYFGP